MAVIYHARLEPHIS